MHMSTTHACLPPTPNSRLQPMSHLSYMIHYHTTHPPTCHLVNTCQPPHPLVLFDLPSSDGAQAQSENGELSRQLQLIYTRLRILVEASPEVPGDGEAILAPEDCEAAAAVILREAILELTHDWERRTGEPAETEN